MRLHISIEDEVVRQLDEFVAPRERSSFIEDALKDALLRRKRLLSLEKAIGSISDSGHEWDEDPAAWVRAQRDAEPRA